MLDWLIVGGGIHGTYISNLLTQSGKVPASKIRVLDPHLQPLQRWRECTENTGMNFLRSPQVHHIGIGPWELRAFSRKKKIWKKDFTAPNHRPGLSLFNAHCEQVVQGGNLRDIRICGTATALNFHKNYVCVETEKGVLQAQKVLLATGLSDHLYYPEWALAAKQSGVPVFHIFEKGFRLSALSDWNNAVVIGGGISAVQAAVYLCKKQPGAVTLVSRKTPKIREYDADPGWMGPKYLSRFYATKDLSQRRKMIQNARNTGSVTPFVFRELNNMQRNGALNWLVDEVNAFEQNSENQLQLQLENSNEIVADIVILATGFCSNLDTLNWLKKSINTCNLPCAACGYPVVNRHLMWHNNLYVTGPFAELEIGPVSRNILGARMAGERLLDAC